MWLDLDPATFAGDRVVSGGGCGNSDDFEDGLCSGLADGADEVTVERELPSRMRCLKLVHDRVQLCHQHRRPSSPLQVIDWPMPPISRFHHRSIMQVPMDTCMPQLLDGAVRVRRVP